MTMLAVLVIVLAHATRRDYKTDTRIEDIAPGMPIESKIIVTRCFHTDNNNNSNSDYVRDDDDGIMQ